MGEYSIDKPVCKCGRGLSGMDRQSAESQGSVTDRSGGRQLSLNSTLGPGSSGGNSAGFFSNAITHCYSPAWDQGHEEPAYPPVP